MAAGDSTPGPDNVYGSGRLNANFANLATPAPTPAPSLTPLPSITTGGGGCRLVAASDTASAVELLGIVAGISLYGAWLSRRR